MRTTESNEFYASLQKYVFITPDVEINTETNLPYDEYDYRIVDVADMTMIGTPFNEDGEELELWAVLEPGETVP